MSEKLKQIILKADDRGGSNHYIGEQKGIDVLVEMGLITDVSVIIGFTGEEEKDSLHAAINKSPLRNRPGVGILLHANFVRGRPICNPDLVPSLVDNDGIFKRPSATTLSAWKDYVSQISMDDFQKELDAQIKLFCQRFGHYPHALDAHNMNLWYPPQAVQITLDIAEQLKIPITSPKKYTDNITSGPFYEVSVVDRRIRQEARRREIPTADHTSVAYWNSTETLEGSIRRFLKALGSLKPGITEFFFHPAHPDFTSPDPRYERGRVRDFMILTDQRVINRIRKLNLTSYKELSKKNRIFISQPLTPNFSKNTGLANFHQSITGLILE